jgi:hypothetical protein
MVIDLLALLGKCKRSWRNSGMKRGVSMLSVKVYDRQKYSKRKNYTWLTGM